MAELQNAKGVSAAADRVSIYAQAVAQQRKQREPLRLGDVESDPHEPWMKNLLLSTDSGKRGYMKPEKRVVAKEPKVQLESQSEQEYRDTERLIPRHEQRFKAALERQLQKKYPPPPRMKYCEANSIYIRQ